MTRCLARWVIATSLACIWIAEGSATVRADEAPDDAVAAPAPVLFPFHPAYRSRPPRQPASLPATSPDAAVPVEEPIAASEDQQPTAPDANSAESPASDTPSMEPTADGSWFDIHLHDPFILHQFAAVSGEVVQPSAETNDAVRLCDQLISCRRRKCAKNVDVVGMVIE